MAKRIKTKAERERPKNYCRDCEHKAIDTKTLSVKGDPIFSSCQFTPHKTLLNYDSCRNFKQETNQFNAI